MDTLLHFVLNLRQQDSNRLVTLKPVRTVL